MVLTQLLSFLAIIFSVRGSTAPLNSKKPDAKVIILGGGVAGVIAAQTFHQNGITDFIIIEGRSELGGRLKSTTFAGVTVELGANWVQGTQTGNGSVNPILRLVEKHGVKTQFNDYASSSSITKYDQGGLVDFSDVYNASVDAYTNITISAGGRVPKRLVDINGRTAYDLIGVKPRDAHAKASEYYQFDWEYAQSPEETSAIASSWANNFTFNPDEGGFSEDNLLSIDQRGFKTFIQAEAKEFLTPAQVRLNSIVKRVSWSTSGVKVTLKDGSSISGAYALCTFSLGVLQNDDVEFTPGFPEYKREAIASMTIPAYTKIFLKFAKKFWFDTEMALYSDLERGRYPVWQSLDHPNFLPGSGILFVTVTGDFSKRIEAFPDEKVKQEVLGVLHAMYPNITIPPVLNFTFPRWLSDPLYRGSFSNWPSSFFEQHHDNLRTNLGRLYFAGEATSKKYFGFLHGAYFEGHSMAENMIRCIEHGACAQLRHFKEVKNAGSYRIEDVEI